MKFIAPEVEIKMFNVVDVLTASQAESEAPEETTISAFGYILQGSCNGNAGDNLVPDCV